VKTTDYDGMTLDEAARIVRADLIEYLQGRDMARTVGFPHDNSRLLEAARLRLAQDQVTAELRSANGEPALVVRRPGR
jgi:hypothetical protein